MELLNVIYHVLDLIILMVMFGYIKHQEKILNLQEDFISELISVLNDSNNSNG